MRQIFLFVALGATPAILGACGFCGLEGPDAYLEAPPESFLKKEEILETKKVRTKGVLGSAEPIPMALEGEIYFLPERTRSLPDFDGLEPVGKVYATELNVKAQAFDKGFPGITDRFEWFAIDYHGHIRLKKKGTYRFRVTSDDGSKLFIDDELVVDNDGTHPPRAKEGTVKLKAGIHEVRVQYFQGPRVQVALMVELARGDRAFEPLSTSKSAVAKVARTREKVRLTLKSSLLFDFEKHTLKSEGERALKAVLASVAGPEARVVVEGHTDSVGKEGYNLELSRRRAATVESWLKDNGVLAEQITARGYGELWPRFPNDSKKNRARNRRVEIVVSQASQGE